VNVANHASNVNVSTHASSVNVAIMHL